MLPRCVTRPKTYTHRRHSQRRRYVMIEELIPREKFESKMVTDVKPAPPKPDWFEEYERRFPMKPHITEKFLISKSRDWFWRNPMLKKMSKYTSEDYASAFVAPSNINQLQEQIEFAYEHNIPITPRGSGYGYLTGAMCLNRGLLLETSQMNEIVRVNSFRGTITAQPGALIKDIRAIAWSQGWDLRIFSNMIETTIAGYISSTPWGMGSLKYGSLEDPGAIYSAKVMTIEKSPKILTLTADHQSSISALVESHGTAGLLTEVELALAPLENWLDCIVSFPNLTDALDFCNWFNHTPSISKRECALYTNPSNLILKSFNVSRYSKSKSFCDKFPDNEHVVFLSTTESSVPYVTNVIKSQYGKLVHVDHHMDEGIDQFVWQQTFFCVQSQKTLHGCLELHGAHPKDIPNVMQTFTEAGIPQEQLNWHFEYVATQHGLEIVAKPIYDGSACDMDLMLQVCDTLKASGMVKRYLLPKSFNVERLLTPGKLESIARLRKLTDPKDLLKKHFPTHNEIIFS